MFDPIVFDRGEGETGGDSFLETDLKDVNDPCADCKYFSEVLRQ